MLQFRIWWDRYAARYNTWPVRLALLAVVALLLVGGVLLYRWFRPAAPPALTAALPASSFRATLTAVNPPALIGTGQTATVTVKIRNDGDQPWPVATPGVLYGVTLGNRWIDPRTSQVVLDDNRVALPAPLFPGKEATATLTITAPHAGLYTLDIDLLQEGVGWSGQNSKPPLQIVIRVMP